MEYFRKRNILLSTSVASLLRRLGSPFSLESAEGKPKEWADAVTLEHLMSHNSGKPRGLSLSASHACS